MLNAYRPQTISQTLARGIVVLAKWSDSARTDAQLLLAHVLQRDKEWIIAHGEAFLSKAQAERFTALCDVRASGLPMAYILGTAYFYGREFLVNDKVLIPRPESEHLVEDAIAHLKTVVNPGFTKQLIPVLDVGLGSGAIACSIAAEVPQVVVEGTEISPFALKAAETNARRLNVHSRCKFHFGDLTQPLGERQFEVIVANLPYVPTADIAPAPNPVSFEPREALDGGPDGLALYRRLLPTLPSLLKPGGLVLLEAAPPVMNGLVDEAQRAFPHGTVEVGYDYGGRERYVRITTPKP